MKRKIICALLSCSFILSSTSVAFASTATIPSTQNTVGINQKLSKSSIEETMSKICSYIDSLSDDKLQNLKQKPKQFVANDSLLRTELLKLPQDIQDAFYVEVKDYKKPNVENNRFSAFPRYNKTWEEIKLEVEIGLAEAIGIHMEMTKHAAEEAVADLLTAKQVVEAVVNGKKCIDRISGARVLWDKDQDIAVIVGEEINRIITLYHKVDTGKMWRWATSNWKW